jgi:hypothetical protein
MYTESKDRVMSTFSKFKITFDFIFFSFTTAAAYGEGKKAAMCRRQSTEAY